ncbi:MAG: transporter [Verrucomicrobiota bacterium]|jgi:opacity protein-like surface antigen|nr:transporter [Verrucomicrobiota bacterium]
MKRTFIFALLLAWGTGSAVSAAPSADSRPPEESEAVPPVAEVLPSAASRPGWMQRFRLSLGTRILYISLLDDRKGQPFHDSFVGSIYKLDAEQNALPIHPYLQLTTRLNKWDLGGGISYSYLKTSTRDNGSGDGAVKSDAVLGYLLAAYSAAFSLTPFVEAGIGYAFTSFDAFSDWSENGKREFDLDDSFVYYVGGGCAYAFTPNWSVNAYVRYMQYDVDGKYIYRGDSRAPQAFTFPMEQVAFGLGVTYAF